jgi:DNA mismatch endonuclease, patch repair protein
MADVVPPDVRSRMMAKIKPRDTKIETTLRKSLHAIGFRYRLHVSNLPGKPDVVLPRWRAVIFANGCFWHGHNCPLFVWPKSRPEWWREKIFRNQSKDKNAIEALIATGWRVGIVWECALKGRSKRPLETVISSCDKWLRSEETFFELRGSE